MPTEFIPAQVQFEYVCEVATDVETQQEARVTQDLPIQLVERSQFNDKQFWDVLFGNYMYHERFLRGMHNPHVRYLTTDSVEKIRQHRVQFSSGIDFQHLPAGFYLAKNPKGGGVCDVLHYNEYYAIAQHKENLKDDLAITLTSNEELNRAVAEEQLTFPGPQAAWYTFLQTKNISNQGAYCTEKQLQEAFIHFSNIIQGLGLTFNRPDFADCLLTESVNPIVLLGRWETVMCNPRLKAADVKAQWEQLTQLPLAKSHEAIRAITDYSRDQRPCGFIRADMNLTEKGLIIRTDDHGFFRPQDDFKAIMARPDASFWRYIAYQPKRNSIEFYEKALARIEQMQLSSGTHEKLIQILAASTTRSNHSADTQTDEEIEYLAWDVLCKVLLDAPMPIAAAGASSEFTKAVVDQLYRVEEQPNIPFLGSIAKHIGDNLSVFGNEQLVILSNKLNFLVRNIRGSLYHGAKFYFVDREWAQLDIKTYVELQYQFYKLTGGQYSIESMHTSGDDRDINISPKFTLLSSHLSTFNIKTPQDIHLALTHFPEPWSRHDEERLVFFFDLFNDIQKNTGLKPIILAELIGYVTSEETAGENWRMVILDYLNTPRFAPLFADHYFENKERQIRNDASLTPEQIAKIKACSFSHAAETAIISMEAAIARQSPPQVDALLARINDLLMNLKQMITPEDFTLFTEQLDDMRAGVATNYSALPTLIEHIIEKRTLEGFNQIFIRNDIEKSTDTLLEKFTYFIQDIKPLTSVEGLKLDILVLQETLATMVLNSPMSSKVATSFYQQLIQQLNETAIAHPHIKHYLLDCFNHIPDKNTPNYAKHVVVLGKNLLKLNDILKPGSDAQSKENMFVIYSLLANYHQRPIELSRLFAQIRPLPKEQWPFILKFVSRLIDNNQSIDGVEQLVEQLNADKQKLETFTRLCKTPPYPDVQTLSGWLQNNTFNESYAAFSLKPYGDRQLQYAFKLAKYRHQQSNFVGMQDIFTDDVGQSLNTQLSDNRKKTIQALTAEYDALRQSLPLSNADKLKLMCLCIEMLARTASQLSHDNPPTIISQELNTTQVMALYAKMINPNNRLISQIDTGEGKSRIMMVLAACQAAQGKTVDFLTSDMQLAERDYLSYKQFFTSLDIPTSLITLNTPSQLYQKNGVNFTDNGQLLLLRNRSDIELSPHAYLDEQANKRCLLIDEVDKFIHDKSKDAYNYAAQSKHLASYVWVYPKLVKYLDLLALAPDAPFDADSHVDRFVNFINTNTNRMQRASFAKLVAEEPEQIKTWLRSAYKASRMEANKHYVMTEPEKEKLYLLRDNEGHARYSRKIFVLDNGRPVEGSTFSEGVHQCLCAKENLALNAINRTKSDAFLIQPENETLRASFPVTFMARYDEGSIYGVSGTTRSAAPLSNHEEINYEKFTYLTMPREKPLIRDDMNTWLAKDEDQQIGFIKRAMLAKLTAGSPVLLICKDDQQSSRLHKALHNDAEFMHAVTTLRRVHGLTSKQDEINAIKQAGTPGFVTISTAGMFGRGVDINADNLLVLAAYVPTEEDEIQIKGRTARIGKPGEYRMIPNMRDTDYSLDGYTYNVHNQVVESQKKRQVSAAFHKEVGSLYAFFLEDITKQFLDDFERCPNERRVERLKTWQKFLGQMQKDWDKNRQKLLTDLTAGNQQTFTDTFNAFTDKWVTAVPVELIANVKKSDRQAKDIHKSYTALMAQQRFFTPQRQAIKVQRDYDPADDGQARIYSSLFPKTIATLRGERRWFADYHAWREGRGYMFPDLMAVLNGEKPLFADLIATITRWIAEWSAWLKAEIPPGGGQQPGGAHVPPPEEGDLNMGYVPL